MCIRDSAKIDERGQFSAARVSSRRNQQFRFTSVQRIDFMDVAPRQIVGVSAALIPFLEHDDANRALMGSNMQRQAVPLLQPDVPVVSTGMEEQAALNSGQVVLADVVGEVVSVSGEKIVVMGENGPRTYNLRKYKMCIRDRLFSSSSGRRCWRWSAARCAARAGRRWPTTAPCSPTATTRSSLCPRQRPSATRWLLPWRRRC